MASEWPQDGPKRSQDGPKTAPRWPRNGVGGTRNAVFAACRAGSLSVSLGGLAEEGAEHRAEQAAVPETPLQHGGAAAFTERPTIRRTD